MIGVVCWLVIQNTAPLVPTVSHCWMRRALFVERLAKVGAIGPTQPLVKPAEGAI